MSPPLTPAEREQKEQTERQAMKQNCLVYISGPISPKNGRSVEQNVADALAVYIELTRLGIPSVCVHLGAMFPSCHAALSYERWMELDLALIDHATHVLMIGDWTMSSGAIRERDYAITRGKPIISSVEEMAETIGVEQ